MRRRFPPARALLAGAALLALAARLEAAVVLKGKAVDAGPTVRAVLEKVRQGRSPDPGFKLPWAGKEITVELVASGEGAAAAGRGALRWKTTTDGEGLFTIDTGLEKLPSGARFVAQAQADGEVVYSPFFLHAGEAPAAVHLYRTSEDPRDLRARVEVVYDVQKDGDLRSLRVRATVQLVNQGEFLYVGRRQGSLWREVFRLPLPEGAKVLKQSSPDPASPGWRLSGDGRALIIDTPIPGLLDIERQGAAGSEKGWEVTYILPPRQVLAQAYPVPFAIDEQAFSAWCVHEEMVLESAQLEAKQMLPQDDPLTGTKRQFDIIFSNRKLRPGEPVLIALSVDNLALGQVSRRAVKWVGGFVLLVMLAVFLGLVLARKGPAPEILLRSLSGEEVLDRIADLDARYERRELKERDYRRYREALVELAAEELAVSEGPAAARPSDGKGPAPRGGALPPAARGIVERIEAIDRSGATDPKTISERTHLLEALLKALSREERSGGRSEE